MTRRHEQGLPQLAGFSDRVVAWQHRHGRHHLPWQAEASQVPDPYRVWLSEVMLQQTQVGTVLAYFQRFVDRFPNVRSLAAASVDEVLALWTGLGYYSRARNLHRCAQVVVREHGGLFPLSAEVLVRLPGVGRSTAAAIASTCADERVAILDGNVKRVLARVLAYADDLGQAKGVNALWRQAEELLPQRASDMRSYTQGMMDLGAMLCTRRRPACTDCPVQAMCRARALGEPEGFPVKTSRLVRQSVSWWWLVLRRDDGAVWLEQRPWQGIWSGLHAFPTWNSWPAMQADLPPEWLSGCQHGTAWKHVLTHRDLFLHPVHLQLGQESAAGLTHTLERTRSQESPTCGWYLPHEWKNLGLPQPVLKALLHIE